MFKIKICGVKDTETVAVLNKLTPDYVGFILTDGFKRSITESRAEEIRAALDSRIATVGVFVNDGVEKIAELFKRGVINAVQLHGDEDFGYIKRLKDICPAPVIKAAGIRDGKVMPYPDNCDYLLLDAYAPTERGGTGRKVEWRRYSEIDKKFFLAGGITPENVREALEKVAPFGVDCSGGVETDGVKDAAKIEKYVKNIRECERI